MPDHYRRRVRQTRTNPARAARTRTMRRPAHPPISLASEARGPSRPAGASACALPMRLGHYLQALGLISQAQLDRALAEQTRSIAAGSPMALGDLLVAQGALTTQDLVMALLLQQLDRVLEVQVPVGTRLGELLVQAGVITAAQFATALMSQIERRRQGEHVLIGQILIAQGVLAPERLASALRDQTNARDAAQPDPDSAT